MSAFDFSTTAKDLLHYLKGAPAILVLIANSAISLLLVVLGRLKQWLKSTKRLILFSTLIALLLSAIASFILTSIGLFPVQLQVQALYFFSLFIAANSTTFIAISLTSDKTAMGKHESQIEDSIQEVKFKDRIKRVTESLSSNLKDIDIQTNWSALNFVPLDAEVELIRDGKSRQKRVTDLLKAIKSSGSERLFLVIGDPGSNEVNKTGKIPIYINLKEWQDKWDRENTPSVEQLNNFVMQNLKKRDIVTTEFFNKHYSRLYEQGRLYFILDSFDEIPSVLGEQENSVLIKQLSAVMHDFLSGARQNSQGIVSSRIFRRPTEEFKTRTVLEIRPFSESKINQTFYKTLGYGESVVKQLFKERFDLLNLASNPFTASLLASYARNNQDNLPNTLLDLYESYFDGALNNSEEIIKSNKISKQIVEQVSLQIATVMFDEHGFEVSISTLKERLHSNQAEYVDQVIDVLQFARIGRRSRETGLFSFSHRRFCEFFVVKQMVNSEEALHLEDIPKDSQWRDTLVMYCQVANESQAFMIAEYCWSIIKSSSDILDMQAIHCMRFLRDAFKARPSIIEGFRDDLAMYLLKSIESGKNVINSKISIECLGLLDKKHVDEGSSFAMKSNNIWLIENAIKSCRTLPTASKELQNSLRKYVKNLGFVNYLVKDNDLLFSLSLSPGMRDIKKTYIKLIIDTWLLLILTVPIVCVVLYNSYKGLHGDTGFLVAYLYIIGGYFLSRQTSSILTVFVWRELLWLMVVGFIFHSVNGVLFFHYAKYLFSLLTFLTHSYLTGYSDVSKRLKNILKDIFENGFFSGLVGICSVLLVLVLFGCIVYLFVKYIPDYAIKYTFIFLLGTVGPILIITFIRAIIHTIEKYHSIIKAKCTDRAYISSIVELFGNGLSVSGQNEEANSKFITRVLNNFEKSFSLPLRAVFLNKFLTYLEINVQKVKGEWTDTSIFKANNQSRALIRLARLEEKWRGMNR
jgi:hypothetical protein